MRDAISLALVGDFRAEVVAHACIPRALELAGEAARIQVVATWIGTETIRDAAHDLARFDAVWVVPASPYRNMDGALAAIRFARETGRPFLGTCGGFQHALIELARNVAGRSAADHAETNPTAPDLVVTPLRCSLVGETGTITFTPGSRMHTIFGGTPTQEGYHCSYGLEAAWRPRLEAARLRFTGFDTNGDVRAAELPSHPFFIGTLFQPERSAPTGRPHPLITAFVRAAGA